MGTWEPGNGAKHDVNTCSTRKSIANYEVSAMDSSIDRDLRS